MSEDNTDPWPDVEPDWSPPGSAADEVADRATWSPIDLSPILTGTWKPPQPAMLTRTDGVSLLYPGLTHSFHGESESGKSLVAQWLAAQLLAKGERVLYLDYESDPGSVVDRLLMFGVTRDQLAAGFDYVQPEVHPTASGAEAHAWLTLRQRRYALAVLDGVTGSLVASRLESNSNDDVTRWSRELPERLAHDTGAAVVMIDHVPKDAQTRGRFAIGGQAKLGRITGAAFTLEPKASLGQGLRGVVALRVAKDRPGQIRRHAGPVNWSDRSAEVARFVLDSIGDGAPRAHLEPPSREAAGEFRPTALMEKISTELAKCLEPASGNKLEKLVPGKADAIRKARDLLLAEGYITHTKGPRAANLYTSAKPYRQADDPASDQFTGQTGLPAADS